MSEFKFDKLDILLKSLSRNDAYIANANTKSTVALSFSAAIIAATGLNYSRVVGSMGHDFSVNVLNVLVFLSISSFLLASVFSMLVIRPRLDLSKMKNNFSFLDIISNYSNHKEYIVGLKEEGAEQFFERLAVLNFNMSVIVNKKNEYQVKSIVAMFGGTLFLSLALLVVILG